MPDSIKRKTNKFMDTEVEDGSTENTSPYAYYSQTLTQKVHHFYIYDEVLGPSHYVELIHQLHVGDPSDVVYIHLNTSGGRLDTGIQIINAMKSSEAHVVCSIEAEAFSLGTLIFLAADEFITHDSCLMMFHSYSGGCWGKGHEQISKVEAENKRFEQLAKRIYIPFLTDEELHDILKGHELWLTSDQIRKRLKKMVKQLEREAKDTQLS